MSMPRPEKLPRREREILDVLFTTDGYAAVDEIRARLVDPPSYSAVRAMLGKLEAKGYVRHREEGLRYVYAPVASKTTARREALQKMVRTFFGGSARQTASALLQHEEWTDGELDALSAEIERVRKEHKDTKDGKERKS